jgi:hypothetical protein
VWRLLPGYVRDADDGTLQDFLAAAETPVATMVGRWLDTLVDQVDPRSCTADTLPWLARLVGADIDGLDTEQARWLLSRRGATADGSDQGIRDAVGATLTGDRTVTLVWSGLWSLTILVPPAGILDSGSTLDAARRNTPAGVDVDITPATAVTLADLAATYPTLAGIAATGKTLDQLRFG